MKAIDWLRNRRAPAKPPLDYKIEPPPPGYTEAGDRQAQPTGFIQFDSALTEQETEDLRVAFLAAMDAAVATGWPEIATDTTTPAADDTPAPVLTARAPWVPVTSAVRHSPQETELLNTAFERDQHCGICAFRYSRCYCGGNR